MPTGTTFQKPTNSRRHTLFKLPDPVRSSPIGTRSRRSSIFNVESRKGGIRLTIAVTPQEKPKKGQGKVLSPPGVSTRTRRSSMYQKGKSLQEVCSKSERVPAPGPKKSVGKAQNKEETALPKKAAATRRSVCPKSPSPRDLSRTSRTTDVSILQSNKGSATKRKSVQPTIAKSETEDLSSPVLKKTRKTPRRSVSKSPAESSDVPQSVEDPVFKTPARPVSSVSEDTQSVSTRKLRSARKTPQVSQSLDTAAELKSPKNQTVSKTPKSSRKTPAQSASKQLRSARKSKSQTPAVSRSTRKRKMELQEDVGEKNTQHTETVMKQKTEVTLSPEMGENPRDESPKFTEVKQKIDLSSMAETPVVKKVRMTPAVSKTSETKSRQSYRKTPAKLRASDDLTADNVSLDESIEFKTPMKTPSGVKKSGKKTIMTPACKTPQVKLTKLSLTMEETKVECVEKENILKTAQVVSPVLDSPVELGSKLVEFKDAPARVQPEALNAEIFGKEKSKKGGKVKKLKNKGKENSTITLDGTLNTTSHSSTGARCTIL